MAVKNSANSGAAYPNEEGDQTNAEEQDHTKGDEHCLGHGVNGRDRGHTTGGATRHSEGK